MDSKEILKIGEGLDFEVFMADRASSNKHHYINNQIKEITQQKKAPCILWNIRPWDNFNIIHAIYCQKLKQLQSIGFNCQIIIYDKLVEKILRLNNPQEIEQLRLTVEKNITWLLNSGLNITQTEFLFESFLWEKIQFNDFSNKITLFAQVCDFDITHLTVDEIFDRFWEIYYEVLLDCDFLITGGNDAKEIWGMLRKKTLETNHFTYKPPTLLVLPQITGINGHGVTPKDANNLLSTNDEKKQIFEKLKMAHVEFLKHVVEFFLLPYLNNRINHNNIESNCRTFHELENTLNSDLISFCTNEFHEYFKKIKGEKK